MQINAGGVLVISHDQIYWFITPNVKGDEQHDRKLGDTLNTKDR
tara:strand:+ start:168 stop:299 length:132 start_codon:yes stop_codon:yes gene_type:complete